MLEKDNIGFLIHHVAFILDKQADVVLKDQFGIGFSQFKILMVIRHKPGLLQRTVAAYLGQTEASVSRQIKLLSEKGYIASKRNAKNKREHIVMLTSEGERVSTELKQTLTSYQFPAFAHLSAKQVSNLIEALQHIHQRACSNLDSSGCHGESNKNMV